MILNHTGRKVSDSDSYRGSEARASFQGKGGGDFSCFTRKGSNSLLGYSKPPGWCFAYKRVGLTGRSGGLRRPLQRRIGRLTLSLRKMRADVMAGILAALLFLVMLARGAAGANP